MRAWFSSFLEAFFLRAWSRRGLTACLLWPLSKLYGAIINFRFGLVVLGYKPQTRLAVPVIVVGNIFVGGTGKTPLVIYLVEQLRARGKTPGVISRGYGVDAEAVLAVHAQSDVTQVGDEPLLIANRAGCPVYVGRQRVAAAQALLQAHPEVDVLISDDGLQHYALARDVEIVLFDQRGAGNEWLLPAGPLREPVKRKRDFTIVNCTGGEPQGALGNDEPIVRMQLLAQTVYRLADASQTQSLQDIANSGLRIAAAAGIGNPNRFFNMLKAAGIAARSHPFADHFAYSAESFSQFNEELILITEKDAVKCRQIPALLQDQRIWVLPVSAQLDADFVDRLLQRLSENIKQSAKATAAAHSETNTLPLGE